MVARIFKNQVIVVYLLLWTAVAVVHFFLLYSVYDLPLIPAVSDSLIFNSFFCLLGIGLWFMAEFSGKQQKTISETLIQHITLSAISITLCLGSGYYLLQSFFDGMAPYMDFLKSTLTIRIFTGIMYYGLMNAFFQLLISYRQLREKKEYEALLTSQLREAELNMLRSQIRPHFLFNSLNSISALTLTNPAKAHEMIIKLSDFMRYSLTFLGETMSTLEKELYHIRLYLEIEKIRFGEKLNVVYDIPDDCLSWPVPAMILQPVVENAIKYGVYEATEMAGINVTAKHQQSMTITIYNSLDPDITPKKGTGTGLKNVAKRLETIYKQHNLIVTKKETASFTVQITFPQHGKNKSIDH